MRGVKSNHQISLLQIAESLWLSAGIGQVRTDAIIRFDQVNQASWTMNDLDFNGGDVGAVRTVWNHVDTQPAAAHWRGAAWPFDGVWVAIEIARDGGAWQYDNLAVKLDFGAHHAARLIVDAERMAERCE